MRKKLLVGSLLAVALILMVPMVSAVEYKTAQTKLNMISTQDPALQAILKKYSKNPQPTCIIIMLLTVLILFLKMVRWVISHFKPL